MRCKVCAEKECKRLNISLCVTMESFCSEECLKTFLDFDRHGSHLKVNGLKIYVDDEWGKE